MITLNASKKITGFNEKADTNKEGYINAGIYIMQKEVLSLIPDDKQFSLEYELFPKITADFYGYESRGSFVDIGTLQGYERAKQFLK